MVSDVSNVQKEISNPVWVKYDPADPSTFPLADDEWEDFFISYTLRKGMRKIEKATFDATIYRDHIITIDPKTKKFSSIIWCKPFRKYHLGDRITFDSGSLYWCRVKDF